MAMCRSRASSAASQAVRRFLISFRRASRCDWLSRAVTALALFQATAWMQILLVAFWTWHVVPLSRPVERGALRLHATALGIGVNQTYHQSDSRLRYRPTDYTRIRRAKSAIRFSIIALC